MNEDGPGASHPDEPSGRGATSAAYRSLFRNHAFRNLTLATFSSALGDWIGFLAIIALTADILGPTNAALFAVSGVMVARVLPSLLIAPVAGVFVDRWDRKRVLIWTDIGRGAVMALIPFTNEILTLVLATLVIEAMSSLFAPAKDAVLPTLVRDDELVAANQVNLLSTYGTLPLSAALFSVLVITAQTFAPEGSFLAERPLALPIWFNALSFWVSAPLLARLTFPRASARRPTDSYDQPGSWELLKEGFRFVGGHPVIRALILGVMVAFAAAGAVITTGEFFARLLNAGPAGYGILVSAVGVGLVLGLLAADPITRRIQPERLFAPGIGIAGAALLTTAAMPTLLAALPPALLMGAGAGVSFIVGYTVLQQRADDRIRGRTFGAFNSGVRLAIFGSTIAVPFLIALLNRERAVDGVYPYVFGGIRYTLMGAGALAVVGAVWVGRSLGRALAAETLDLTEDEDTPLVVGTGVFVVFEGGDGTGKTTQIRLLRSAIERVGHLAVVTREPGGTRVGEQVRDLLLSRTSEDLDDRTEALLYAAARAQHVREVIVPALEHGSVVLCDRYVDSSIAYQGAGRGLGEDAVARLNQWATESLQPDLTVLLDIDPAKGLHRAVGDGTPDRLEAAGLEFHREVRAAFLRRADLDPDRYLVLDATLPVEELHAKIRSAVLRRLDLPAAVPVAEPIRTSERRS
jgi:dTMP kinase